MQAPFSLAYSGCYSREPTFASVCLVRFHKQVGALSIINATLSKLLRNSV